MEDKVFEPLIKDMALDFLLGQSFRIQGFPAKPELHHKDYCHNTIEAKKPQLKNRNNIVRNTLKFAKDC